MLRVKGQTPQRLSIYQIALAKGFGPHSRMCMVYGKVDFVDRYEECLVNLCEFD